MARWPRRYFGQGLTEQAWGQETGASPGGGASSTTRHAALRRSCRQGPLYRLRSGTFVPPELPPARVLRDEEDERVALLREEVAEHQG